VQNTDIYFTEFVAEDDTYEFERKFDNSYRQMLDGLTNATPLVIVVMAPQALECFRRARVDVGLFTAEVKHYLDICKETTAVCVDLTAAFSIDHFIDIMHLNFKGQAALADRLAELIVTHSDPSGRGVSRGAGR
jgi:lysophospholipase L1-like esterase